MPEVDAAGERLAIAVWRLLAEGSPVGAAELAEATGLSQPDIAALLGEWPGVFTDADRRVAGGWGLGTGGRTPAPRFGRGSPGLCGWCALATRVLARGPWRVAR